ncbi:uncharacterized protein FIESC28_05975 [Fusarium coffeatum]|uniref:Uncharacterized protein n=1 Tax=Fusarium coffeatum TaxID=231269 RepID=A0A366RQ44_9HYPO|nr:uncharacterized protein FIESC28_05975 [Fusarium coffeatum]RBR18520.1 hypothetical protein FIESC28_05975 [Fusarium coffeatum]
MEQQNEKGKHKLSPQTDPAVTKKSRPTCFVETPGGSLRETNPSTDHQPSSSAMAPPGSKLKEAPSLEGADDIETAQSSFSSSLPIRPATESTRTTPANYDLSEQHLSTLSVREKLRKGIAMSLANDVVADTVPGMMINTDIEHHVDPKLTSYQFRGRGTEMVNHELTARVTDAYESMETRGKMAQHRNDGIPQARIAGARLQAVTRTANYNPFKPFTYVPSPHPNNTISEAEQREGLTAWLESACRRFGYKTLEIDRLSFRHDFQHNELTLMERGNDFWVAPNESYSSPVYIDTAHEGSITLYEANISSCGHPPEVQKWTWFKITKPFSRGRPRGVGDVVNSGITFAIPTANIEKLVQEWRFSTNGIPTFTTPQAMDEKKFWGWVQRLMGSNACLVEAISKKGWVRIDPEPQQSEGSDSRAPGRRAAARGASGLRNEV